ncbi:MAG: NUDIX hydrolase [Syntrophomonadaceae bacterium]|nr:NUDIX hydrolase [Syntrophomonadaceae bacterium]
MAVAEKTLHSERIFSGKILNLRVDTVALPGGQSATREIVEHPGAVGIIAVDEDETVYLVRQYRKPVEEALLEIPAGKLEPEEDPLECARRELLEETGLIAESLEEVLAYYTTPGFTSERLHIFVARQLKPGKSNPDQDEFLELVKMPLDEAYQKIAGGDIKDGKSIIAIQHLVLQRAGARD